MNQLHDDARFLLNEMEQVRKLAKGLGKPQLGTSSIEAGKVEEYDANGTLTQIIGEQHDGTHTAATVAGPPPPEPVAPTVTVGVGSAQVRWSGRFADDALSPMDFSHVSVHASRLEVFGPDADSQKATIAGETGDLAVILLDSGVWVFGLVAVSKAGKWSEMSETVAVEIADYPSSVDIQDGVLSLEGKMTVSTRPPNLSDGNDKPNDALWNEIDPVSNAQVAVWRWDGVAWVDFPITETMLPLVNIAEGTYGRLRGAQLSADAIDGMTIVGSDIRTVASPANDGGVQVNSGGIRAWAPGGGSETFSLSAATGNVLATGNFQTARSGRRALLSDNGNTAALDFFTGVGTIHGAFYTTEQTVPQTAVRHYNDTATFSYGWAFTPNGAYLQSGLGHADFFQILADIVYSPAIYNRTYTSAGNVVITSNGILGRSTSRRANKLAIEEIPANRDDAILSLKARTWFDRTESEDFAENEHRKHRGKPLRDSEGHPLHPTPDKLRRIPGMVAEEVEEAGLTEFLQYGSEGEVEGLMYERLGVALIPVVARLRDRVDAQQAKIANLESSLELLTTRLANLENQVSGTP